MDAIVRRMTTGAMALAVALGLALGAVAFTVDAADAMKVPLGGDSHQRGCYSLQEQGEALLDEYGDASTTDARRVEILGELRSIGSTWDQIGCRSVWGDIDISLEFPDDPHLVFDRSIVASRYTTVGVYK